jgi:hypothetical protein
MSRKVRRVRYALDTRGIESLPDGEIAAILRGADDLTMSGGRNLLAKVLKGSRAKVVLDLGLEASPVYGYYAHLTLPEVLARVDWMIVHDYLAIEYDYRLPLLRYTSRGWEIERHTYAEELLRGFDDTIARGGPYEMSYLKGRARDMILALLDKVEQTGDAKYIPLLEVWAKVDYKKVRSRIRQVINRLEQAPSS